ncbi:MAG: hypothetical protein KGJ41_17055 [Rhodospirillales bacterium]|nr:hypothetical protein [Rhodospirillales bacterium]
MFDRDRFIAECQDAASRNATDDNAIRGAVRDILARAVAEPAAVLRGLGEPSRAGIDVLYRSNQITVVNLVWGQRMSIMPHNHNMWALIGIYTGREDNIFWRRMPGADPREITAAGARSLCAGDVDVLGRDIIHSVLNPIDRLTGAIHIYGGDFVAAERSQWDAENLREKPFDHAEARRLFEEANIGPGRA